MASKLVIDAVEARLAANWSHCQVYGLNSAIGDSPADGSGFLTVQYPVATEEQISVGSPGSQLYREEGGFWLVLAMPRASGAATGLTWADELRDLFRSAQFGGISCLEASPPTYDDSSENGQYVRLTVVVLYYADIIG